jgi:hypothetical protein
MAVCLVSPRQTAATGLAAVLAAVHTGAGQLSGDPNPLRASPGEVLNLAWDLRYQLIRVQARDVTVDAHLPARIFTGK